MSIVLEITESTLTPKTEPVVENDYINSPDVCCNVTSLIETPEHNIDNIDNKTIWCLDDECLESMNCFINEDELALHVKEHHSDPL